MRKLSVPKPMRLSPPALETLAIVAYRQPIMRSEVEKIRGVDSGGVLKTLLERRLLRIVGRSQEPGQPLLYGTTKEFLEIFNLNTLKELPTLKDIDELMRERRAQIKGERKADGDDEDLTEILEEDEEEETEIIRRKPLDEDEEEEKKDMEALSELEGQLKGIRRLEKAIFPKQVEQSAEGVEAQAESGNGNGADEEKASEGESSGTTQESEVGDEYVAACDEGAPEDAPAADDRAGN
jgi:segregation and condensation protein B